jgi:hypothetical protein
MSRISVSLLLAIIFFLSFTPFSPVPDSVQATDFSTDCKWAFPWDREVHYYLYNSQYDSQANPMQFSFDDVLRISYGANTWSEANFNLHFQEWRTLKSAAVNTDPNNEDHFSWVHRGNPGADVPADTVARVLAWDLQENQIEYANPCNMDQGNPVVQFNIIYNQDMDFHEDCLASALYCYQNDLYDFHAVAAHEFGHTFMMKHSANRLLFGEEGCTGDHYCWSTMASGIWPAETIQRTLHDDDKEAAWLMYGCRNTGTTFNC